MREKEGKIMATLERKVEVLLDAILYLLSIRYSEARRMLLKDEANDVLDWMEEIAKLSESEETIND